MRKFIINENLLHGILQYLVSRPYSEVANAVVQLEQLEELRIEQENKE